MITRAGPEAPAWAGDDQPPMVSRIQPTMLSVRAGVSTPFVPRM
jgi:hypothetical protein